MGATRPGFMIWTYEDKIIMSCNNKFCDDIDDKIVVEGPNEAWPDLSDLIAAGAHHNTMYHPVCPECLAGKHQNCDGQGGVTDEGRILPCGCEAKTPLNNARHPW